MLADTTAVFAAKAPVLQHKSLPLVVALALALAAVVVVVAFFFSVLLLLFFSLLSVVRLILQRAPYRFPRKNRFFFLLF